MNSTKVQLATLGILLSLTSASIGCGRDTANFCGQSTKTVEKRADVASEPSLQLSESELSDLRLRLRTAHAELNSSTIPKINAAMEACSSIVAKYNRFRREMAFSATEVVGLESRKYQIEVSIKRKLSFREEQRYVLALIQGRVESLNNAIAALERQDMAQLAAQMERYSDRIDANVATLTKVRKQIDGVIHAVPFDSQQFDLLEKREDELTMHIVKMREILAQLIGLVMSGSTSLEISKLKQELITAEAKLKAEQPELLRKITALSRQVSTLRRSLFEVVRQLNRASYAADLELPQVPRECELLGFRVAVSETNLN